MKNLKKLLPLLVLSLFVLAACTNPLAKKASENGVVQTSVIVTETAEVTSASGCSILKNADNRQNCEQQVDNLAGTMLTAEIIDTFDVKRCKELSDDLVQQCELQLTDTGVDGPVSDAELTIYKEALRGALPEPGDGDEFSPFPEYDVTKCDQLTTSGYKAYCVEQVTRQIERTELDEIALSGDANRCDELKNEDLVANCKLLFGIGVVSAPVPAVAQ